MNNHMVVNTKFTENPNIKHTGLGIYDDIETNMLDIATRAINECHTVNAVYKTIQEALKCSPEFVDFQSSPVLFCWCSGSDFEYNELGGNSGKSINGIESFYCHVYYGVTGRNGLEMHKSVRSIASVLSEYFRKNLNLNDIVDGPSEFVSTEFASKLMRFNKQMVPMNGVHMKIIYRMTTNTNIYSNPNVPNF